MKLLSILGHIVTPAYLIVWFLLLIDCIRRKEFYPVFGKGRGTQAFWLATFLLFNPVLTLLYLVFGRMAGPNARPSWLRSAMVLAPVAVVLAVCYLPFGGAGSKPSVVKRASSKADGVEEGGSRATLEAQAGVLEAKNNMNSRSVVSAPGNARFPCRRILILNRSSHRLLERVGVGLQKHLVKLPFVHEVAYLPAGTAAAPGDIAPDVVITLDLPYVKVVELPLHRSLEATIATRVGTVPYYGRSHVHASATPPVCAFEWVGTLSHTSKMRGYETAGAKYKMAADNIAGEIGKTLSKQFAAWVEKYGVMPELPEAFYGTYQPAPEFAFLPDDSCEQVVSNRSLFYHNRTTWRFTDDRDTTSVLTAIQEQMEEQGWRTLEFSRGRETSMNLRMSSGTERLQAFRQQRENALGWMTGRKTEQPADRMPVVVHYMDAFTEDEIQTVLADWLDGDVSPDTLLIFENFFTRGPLRDRFFERLETQPVQTAEGCLALGRLYESRGDGENARAMLMRTKALLRTRKNNTNLENAIKTLAKKLGDEDLAKATVPEEVFRDLGFIDLEDVTLPFERDVALDEPVRFFQKNPDGEIVVIQLRVERPTDPEDKSPYTLSFLTAGKSYRSWGKHGGRVHSGSWRVSHGVGHKETSIFVEAVELKDGRFRMSIRSSR